jgi:hypothetical protein
VIFDVSWNPTHDKQSLFRVYRFGQMKPVYIYRLIAEGTIEEPIYKRQVTKESTSMRVIDEQYICRHYEQRDLDEMYRFSPTPYDPERQLEFPKNDRLLADIIHENPEAIVDYHQHDSLFQNLEDETLTEEEKKQAWEEYELEKDRQIRQPPIINVAANASAMLNNAVDPQQLQRLQQQRIGRLMSDLCYLRTTQIPGMRTETALNVTTIKWYLEAILPMLPPELRGDITSFDTYFLSMIQDAHNQRLRPEQLEQQVVAIFRKVVDLAMDIDAVKPALRGIYAEAPQLFEPTALRFLN